MKRIIGLLLTLFIVLSIFLSMSLSLLAADGTTNNDGEQNEYIYYTDLFYAYPNYLLDDEYFKSYSSDIDYVFTAVFDKYKSSPAVIGTGIEHAMDLFGSPTDIAKFAADFLGLTNFDYNKAIDSANKKIMLEFFSDSKYSKVLGTYKKIDSTISNIQKAFKKLDDMYSYDPGASLDGKEDLEYVVAYYSREIYAELWKEGILKEFNETFFSRLYSTILEGGGKISNYFKAESNAISIAKSIIEAIILENAKLEIIDDILATQTGDSLLRTGMLRLKNQLAGGSVTYFMDIYVKSSVLGELCKNIDKFIVGEKGLAYKSIAASVEIIKKAVFKIWDVPKYDDVMTYKVLAAYSYNLLDGIKKKGDVFIDGPFVSDRIVEYSSLFDLYTITNKLALESLQKIADCVDQYEDIYALFVEAQKNNIENVRVTCKRLNSFVSSSVDIYSGISQEEFIQRLKSVMALDPFYPDPVIGLTVSNGIQSKEFNCKTINGYLAVSDGIENAQIPLINFKNKYGSSDIYDNHINSVKNEIYNISVENRKVISKDIYSLWTYSVDANTKLRLQSDRVERGCLYTVNDYLHIGNINMLGDVDIDPSIGIDGTVSIVANTVLKGGLNISGDLKVGWAYGSSHTLTNDGTITVYGDLSLRGNGTIINNNKLVINGNTSWSSYYGNDRSQFYNNGTLITYGKFSPMGFTMTSKNGIFNIRGDCHLSRNLHYMQAGSPSIIQITNGTIVIDGTKLQTINGLTAPTIIIRNESLEGIVFTDTLICSTLFNHNGNNFILYKNGNGSSFADYDGDGIKDNFDECPTIPADYSFSYSANGGTGDPNPFTVKYGQDIIILNKSCEKEGYYFGGWNVKRNNDNTWYVAGIGWCSEDTIMNNGYSKKNYNNHQICSLDNSWTNGLKSSGSYTFYATWKVDPINGAEIVDSGSCGDNVEWTLYDNGLLCITGKGKIYDYSYTDRAPWYSYSSEINTVKIDKGVTRIGNHVFSGCSVLTSITIPDSVTSIGDQAFGNCTSLTSITIPDSVTNIGGSAFYGCSSLTSIKIPDSVTNIGSFAFSGCSGLTSVTIPDSVTSIDGSAFSGCSSLTSIKIPDSVTNIGSSVFAGCSGLTSITVSSGNTVYHSANNCLIKTSSKQLILGCKNSIIPDDGSVTNIGSSAFAGCSGLTSITIPDSVTNIGGSAFSGCSSLTSITIPDSVTRIDFATFSGCSSLTGITIPDGVTGINFSAFYGCSNLTNITIPDGVTSIAFQAFYGCSSLTSITIPDSVTIIGGSAFYGCSSLTSITIPDSVTSIGSYAFYYCRSLTSVTIGNGVTSIGNSAFYECYKLAEVINKSSLKITQGSDSNGYVAKYALEVHTGESKIDNVDGYLFYLYEGINYLLGYSGTDTDLVLPDNYNGHDYKIYQHAFYNCSRLTSIILSKGVTGIGSGAFIGCTSITQKENGITYVDKWVIDFDGSITDVALRLDTVGIGSSAFNNCSGLKSITIPDSVTNIDDYAFSWCNRLTSITIGKGITSIGNSAFEYCSGLTSITVPDGVTSIGDSAFYDWTSSQTIYICAKSQPIGWYSDWNRCCEARIVWGHVCTSDKEATCTENSICSACGSVVEPAKGHSFADGICTVCLEVDPDCVELIKKGFVRENGNLYYYADGEKQSGWFIVDGKKYYASSVTKVVISGRNAVIGMKQYLWNDATGLELADGFYENVGTNTYASIDLSTGAATLVTVSKNGTICFDDGYLVYGWRHADGSPISVVDGVYEQYSTNPNNLYYFLSSSFTMVTDSSYTLGGWKREFNADHTVKPLGGLQNYYGTMYYYVDGVAQGGWQTIGGNTYYFYKETGKAASMWMVIGGKVYYFYASTSATPYALKTSGAIGGINYTYATDGSITTTGFINPTAANTAGNNSATYIQRKDGTTMYYENGTRVTGWKQIGGNWYYFYKETGYMCTESRTIGGVWYTFNPNGVCTSK